LICFQVFISVGQTEFLNYTPGSMCSHPLVQHCGSGQLQFFTMLKLDSNGSWIGNDLSNDLNKSHKACFCRSQCCQPGNSHAACISYTYKNNTSATVGRAGWFWFKWPSPNKSLCASQHLTTRLQGTHLKNKFWSFNGSKSASLEHSPYRHEDLWQPHWWFFACSSLCMDANPKN